PWPVSWYYRFVRPVANALQPLTLPVLWLAGQWFSVFAAETAQWPHHLITIAVSLLTAWVVIRLAASLIRNRAWSRAIAVAVWILAALSITGLLDPTMTVLDAMALRVGEVRLSVLGVLKALVALGILLWLASLAAGIIDRRLRAMPEVPLASGVLFGKLFRIAAYGLAVIVGMESVGIDLTTFAVFSGAIGLGIGFGLQKVFSNLISGLILLIDKSVKPGDVIAVGGTYGSINSLGARCISVITRDGTEHLIPNEELISQRVENWSYSNRMVRQKLPIGISYGSDLRLAMQLALHAARNTKRVLNEPPPVCQLKGFGDNAVNIELRLWIDDPQNGIGNVTSEVLLEIWDLYHANGIEFPFPQRDLHIRSLPAELVHGDAPSPPAAPRDVADDDENR
ncbi:MAG: mechanosensitive ion channel domain-containing protein, partial [Rhodospirillaceae bacterium]